MPTDKLHARVVRVVRIFIFPQMDEPSSGEQHADIEERSEIKETYLWSFVWDINVLSKTQLKVFQAVTPT